MAQKQCPLCKVLKNETEFYANRSKPDGLQRVCKLCSAYWNATWYRKLRLEIVEILGGVCVNCGFDDIRALQVDHIDGGGTQEAREIGNHKIYKKIRDIGPEGYQLLCANCNSIKRKEHGEDTPAKRKNGVFA